MYWLLAPDVVRLRVVVLSLRLSSGEPTKDDMEADVPMDDVGMCCELDEACCELEDDEEKGFLALDSKKFSVDWLLPICATGALEPDVCPAAM